MSSILQRPGSVFLGNMSARGSHLIGLTNLLHNDVQRHCAKCGTDDSHIRLL